MFTTVTVYVAVPPGVYVALPSVLVTASVTFDDRTSLSLPLAVLPLARSVALAELTSGSVVRPDANATGTVKTSELAPPASMRAAVAPKLVCPVVPVTVPQRDDPLATQLALAPSVTPAGSASVTFTLSASERPVFTTVTVYVAVPPGVYVALPSVLVTASVTFDDSASLSLPFAVAPLAMSVAVAMLTSGSVDIPAAKATGMVKTIVLAPPATITAPVVPKLVCPFAARHRTAARRSVRHADGVRRQRQTGRQRVGHRDVERVGAARVLDGDGVDGGAARRVRGCAVGLGDEQRHRRAASVAVRTGRRAAGAAGAEVRRRRRVDERIRRHARRERDRAG